jgi:hypothetical protein
MKFKRKLKQYYYKGNKNARRSIGYIKNFKPKFRKKFRWERKY